MLFDKQHHPQASLAVKTAFNAALLAMSTTYCTLKRQHQISEKNKKRLHLLAPFEEDKYTGLLR